MVKINRNALDVKIAVIGAGGRYWCPVLLRDLALFPGLTGELRLCDLRPPQASARLGRELFAHSGSKTSFKIRATADLRSALRGADAVVIGISPGPATAFANDLEIPLRYGILQTVGDTIGPGGISRALRAVPILRGFAQAVAEHAPAAWVINYTNPLTLCTAALHAEFPGIRAYGCCHEVYAAQHRLAGLVAAAGGGRPPPRQAIRLDLAGVNHFTFALGARYRGCDLMPLISKDAAKRGRFADQSAYAGDNAARGAFFEHRGLIGLDLFRRFGALGAAGDRHLAEFVPWYLADGERSLHRWGVVATPAAFRLGTWAPAPGITRAPNPLDVPAGVPEKLLPSGEEGVLQLAALLGGAPLETNVNLPNHGQVPELPYGAVVETNAVLSHNSLAPVQGPPLPQALAALLCRIADEQQLVLQAALECNFDMALQALLMDALCRISTDRAAEMLREMIAANKELLPGW